MSSKSPFRQPPDHLLLTAFISDRFLDSEQTLEHAEQLLKKFMVRVVFEEELQCLGPIRFLFPSDPHSRLHVACVNPLKSFELAEKAEFANRARGVGTGEPAQHAAFAFHPQVSFLLLLVRSEKSFALGAHLQLGKACRFPQFLLRQQKPLNAYKKTTWGVFVPCTSKAK